MLRKGRHGFYTPNGKTVATMKLVKSGLSALPMLCENRLFCVYAIIIIMRVIMNSLIHLFEHFSTEFFKLLMAASRNPLKLQVTHHGTAVFHYLDLELKTATLVRDHIRSLIGEGNVVDFSCSVQLTHCLNDTTPDG